MTVQDASAVVQWLQQHAVASAHLCLDSRQLGRGDVFFACPGRQTDGRQYIAQAFAAGAAAVVAEAEGFEAIPQASLLWVSGLRALLGPVAHAWYGQPSATLTLVAVTGTNGKTSTVQWLAAALNAGQVPCGTIGTLGVTLPDGSPLGGALTTPDVLTTHRSLAALRDAGAVAVALEASSIGLEQGRLDSVQIAFAGFTNLTHDHLDYHHTMAQYQSAKFVLFTHMPCRGAVVNVDDPAGASLFARMHATPCLAYSCDDPQAQVRASDRQTTAHGQVFQLSLPDGTVQVVTPIPGVHNVSNLLLVAGMLHLMGWPLPRVARALSDLQPVVGRLQAVPAPLTVQGHAPQVFVDYAHTPDALMRALKALRPTAQAGGGRLICVFGCGGERDHAKRPLMGKIAAEWADQVFVTSDNPRGENSQDILAQIVQGVMPAPQVIEARAQAIVQAILDASPNDVVLLAGKGHETWQEVQGVRTPFEDRQWAALALAWRGAAGVSTDTRQMAHGQLFVALRGEQFDGHQYLAQAATQGAVGAVVETVQPRTDLPQFCVDNTLRALGHMATAWRRRFSLPLIAVTGSNGKTTTKEMIAAILRVWLGEAAVLVTQGNLNNAIGVPLTLMRLNALHRAAVVELGMNHTGEMAQLAAMAQATVVLVTNAQREHQEFMGSVAAVAQENGAALSALPPDGTAIYPGDDLYTPLWDGLAVHGTRLHFGWPDAGATLDVTADAVVLHDAGAAFCLHLPEGTWQVSLPIAGLHNVRNAMAAAACAHAIGVPGEKIVQGLAAFSPVKGRMQLYTLRGMHLMDDTYNANPDSVRAAIDVLAHWHGARTLVLGDMAEVGTDSAAVHAEVGAYARTRGIQTLLTLGQDSTHACTAFGAGARHFESVSDLVAAVLQAPPAHVLVKGSRFMRMERVVQALQAQCAQGA